MSARWLHNRRLARGAAALLALGGTLGVLATAMVQHRTSSSGVPPIEPFEGWTIKDVRHVFYDGARKVASLSVGEASVRRVRVGVFRLGFASRLSARDLRADILLGSTNQGSDDPTTVLRSMLAALGGSRSVDPHVVTAIRIDGVLLRLHSPGGSWVELTADHADTDALARGRVVFRGDVHVKTDRADLAFSNLTYETRSKRFVKDGAVAHPGGSINGSRVDAANHFLALLTGADTPLQGDQDGI